MLTDTFCPELSKETSQPWRPGRRVTRPARRDSVELGGDGCDAPTAAGVESTNEIARCSRLRLPTRHHACTRHTLTARVAIGRRQKDDGHSRGADEKGDDGSLHPQIRRRGSGLLVRFAQHLAATTVDRASAEGDALCARTLLAWWAGHLRSSRARRRLPRCGQGPRRREAVLALRLGPAIDVEEGLFVH
eukprot:3414947-Prymnesium_polylepis.2